MLKYLIKRTLLIIPILLAVILIVFTILELTPGTPGRVLLGPVATQEQVDKLDQELGTDRPFFERYVEYIKNIILRFDFGTSYRTKKPVVKELLVRFPYTLKLAFAAVLGSSLIGIPIGVLMAAKRNMLIDRSVNILAMMFAAIPAFVLALGMIYLFAVKLEWLPPYGAKTWKHYILPMATLILPSSVGRMRLARTTMLEAIRQEYITMARSKGIPENRVIFVHALRNALIPLITSILTSFSGMLGGTIILENIFGFPGLGAYIINGINTKDAPTVLASTTFLAAVFCLTSLVLDMIYAFVDPRVKERFKLAVK
ncbi:MAG: ABC transporter permease [Oscillospiraceae bacterium]|nr:ABC transporter permease [Oscillospiraceae bacterium]